MFKLKQSTTFTWPVTVQIPLDGGRFDKETFDAEFRRPTQTIIREHRRQYEDEELTDDGLARQILVGWSGVTQEGGEELPFSAAALNNLLDVPGVAKALCFAYTEALKGNLAKN